MSREPDTVLIVDDDEGTRRSIERMLKLDGYVVELAGTVAEALNRENWNRIFAVLLDRKLPDGSADDLLPRLKEVAPRSAVIVITGYSDLGGAVTALREGVADYILKPINPAELRGRLTQILERRLAQDESLLRRKQQTSLMAISSFAMGSHSLPDLFHFAARQLTEVLEVDSSRILKLTPDRSQLVMVAGSGCPEEQIGQWTTEVETAIYPGSALQSETPVLWRHSAEDIENPLSEVGHPSGMGVAILNRGNQFGVLTVQSKTLRGFSEMDRDFLQSVATVLATIIERHRAEQELKRFFDLSLEMLSIVHMNGTFSRVNPAIGKTLGYPLEKLLRSSICDLIHPQELQSTRSVFRQLAEGTPVSNHVTRFRCEDGSYRWLEWNAIPDLAGQVIYAAARDVTSQRQAAEALRQERDFAESLVETAQAIILLLDPQGRIVRYNHYMEELSGYSLEMMRERDFVEGFLPPEERKSLRDRMTRLSLQQGKTESVQADILTASGSRRSISWWIRTLKDSAGQTSYVMAIGHDLTELKKAQENALQSERLAAIGQMVTGLAHESRNALQRAQACLEMLMLDLADRPALMDFAHRTQLALHDLHRLYEEVRSYAAPLKLEKKQCRLTDLWTRCWEGLGVTRRGLQVELEIHCADPHARCCCDPHKFEQVFRNIFENSLAVCPQEGIISICCSETSVDDQPGLEIRIRDNGPGLTPEQASHIFEPFYTTKTKGTGLGMAIVKRIVEAHGGTVSVGTPNTPGAEIILFLPARKGYDTLSSQ